jgi:DNA polymerase-3 subunit delta'
MPYKADHALSLLTRAQGLGRMAHAYLISGPREAGLEDFSARVLGLVSPAGHRDLDGWAQEGAVILRPQSKSRRISVGDDATEVGTIRYLERMIHRTTAPGGYKLGIIVDAERMTQQAQNAFLKTLEEPPARTLLLLLSTHPDQLLTTILSRVIQIPLLPPAGVRQFDEYEQKLLAVLQRLSSHTSGSIGSALGLKTDFQVVLDELYDVIKEEHDEEFDKEKEHYAQTTDGTWLKQREEEVSAQIEALYLQRRDAMMDLVLAWMGDVARQQVGAANLDLPQYQHATARLAEQWQPEETTKRLRALRQLEQHLHTNVNEGLALEVAFIQAFGR